MTNFKLSTYEQNINKSFDNKVIKVSYVLNF